MLSRVSPWFLALVFLGLAVAAMLMPLSSDTVPYAFLFDRAEAHNDQQRFLNAVVDYSGVGQEELQPLLPRLRPVEKQLPVTLFIAKESGKSVAEVLDLRDSKRHLLDVLHEAGLENKLLFEGVEGKFPEPYKAAWVEYRMKYRPELSDQQVRDLILLQLAHRVTGEPRADIVKQGAKGRTPELIMAKHKPRPSEDEAKPGEGDGEKADSKKKAGAKGR
ncbi:MAG TPA: hypothetical protein VMR21_00855 [Vicinamibacteria bacterium]|nr:hypothetical protein [Vicinamibacteria bacterium]